MKSIVLLLSGVVTLCSCKVFKPSYFSYEVNTYSEPQQENGMRIRSNLISYGNYLFEFTVRTNFIKEQVGEDVVSQTIHYDTNGIYILSVNNDQYYQLDTFAIESSFIKKGNLTDKEWGVKFSEGYKVFQSDSVQFYDLPGDTIINGFKLYQVQVNLNKPTASEYNQLLYLVKNKNFNSFHKLRQENYPDPNYCIVGMRVINKKTGEGFTELPDKIRALTKKEIRICEEMLKKAG